MRSFAVLLHQNLPMKKFALIAAASAALQGAVFADVVFLTTVPSPAGSGNGPTFDGTYTEPGPLAFSSFTSAKGTGLGVPTRDGSRFFSNSFSNAVDGAAGFVLTPTLGVPGGIYQIHHNFSSLAGNVSSNVVLTVACSVGGTLSFTNSGTVFQSPAGNPSDKWTFLGYLTNSPGSANPSIEFGYQGGHVSAGASQRLIADAFRFTLYEPCLTVPVVGVTGPLGANLTNVVVTGVAAGATSVTVYQDSGSGMVVRGTKTTDIVAGNNTVTVAGLVKGAVVAATQTVDGQEGCVPTAGITVGGGANPRIRMALSIRETTSTGPAGAAGSTASANLHFLGSSETLSGSPVGGVVVYPSNTWQTVTFDRGTVRVPESSNVVGTASAGVDYAANDKVTIKVYPFKYDPVTSLPFYSGDGAQSAQVTSTAGFTVNWSWAAVAGADGYRLLRDINGAGYTEYADAFATTTYSDAFGWIPGSVVTPNLQQTNASVRWNGTGDNPNLLPGKWGVLDAIALVIDDLGDVGPFDLYLDNLKSGSTVWQTFEGAVSGATDVGFRAPGFSGTTSANMLAAPNQAVVSNGAADSGTKSLRVRFQWAGTNSTRWIRLTTSGVGNPQVNLDEPISFRLLLLPVGSSPVAPPAPSLTAALVGDKTVLNWTDAHRLQATDIVTGTFTNVPGVTTAPWTNTFAEPQMFFRLAD